jgi:hypothetical protein
VAVYALRQIQETRRDRHVQFLADFGRRWDEELLTEARKLEMRYTRESLVDAVAKLDLRPVDIEAQEAFIVLQRIPNYFEDLALIVESGSIDLKLVARGFKDLVLDEWDFWELAIDKYKESDPYWYLEFRNLSRDMRAIPDEVVPTRRRESAYRSDVSVAQNGQSSVVLHSNGTRTPNRPGRIPKLLAGVLVVSAIWAILKRVIRMTSPK